MDPQPPATTSPDLLGDLLGPLAIEGPPGVPESEQGLSSGLDGTSNAEEALAIAPVEAQVNDVQVLVLNVQQDLLLCLYFIILLQSCMIQIYLLKPRYVEQLATYAYCCRNWCSCFHFKMS